MSKDFIRSPIFYMGNKLDLLPLIIPELPSKDEVGEFIDLFGGSGVVSANVDYDIVIYNELNPHIYRLFEMIHRVSPDIMNRWFKARIQEFGLTKAGKEAYIEFRTFYNESEPKDIKDLFLLTHYAFSNLIRFNQKGGFNMPVGNQYYIEERHSKIYKEFHERLQNRYIQALNLDAFKVLDMVITLGKDGTLDKKVFIYLDPPYSNTTAVYNEQRAHGGWTIEHDKQLFKQLDTLNELGVRWALSNVLEHKGNHNKHLEDWALLNNYKVVEFRDKQYSSLGKGNANSREVLIKNY